MKYLYFILLLQVTLVSAQEVLTLNQAVEIALENNYSIKIAKNESEISKNNNYWGVTGAVPGLGITAGNNTQLLDIEQRLSNGNIINGKGAFSNNLNANIALNWTIFDGMKMFATKDKLNELEKNGINKLRSQINNTIAQVVARYSEIQRIKKEIELQDKLINVSEKRLEIVNIRLESGLANNSDKYLAEIDLAAKQQAKAQALLMQKQSINALEQLLVRKELKDFTTDNDIILDNRDFNAIESKLDKNPDLESLSNLIDASVFAEKEIASQKLPVLKFNLGYGVSFANSSAGFSLYNETRGPFVGFTFSQPLYTADVNDRQLEAAELSTKSIIMQKEKLISDLKFIYKSALESYNTAKRQIETEKGILETSQKYLDLTLTKYGLNQSTVLELREAEKSYSESLNRLSGYFFAAKISETELLRLSDSFLK